MLKYSDAKKILAKYQGTAGKCDNVTLDFFVKEVLQYLLIHGTYGNERKFTLCAQNGYITLPKELETPLKIKIGNAIGSVWNRWFEYHSGNDLHNGCIAEKALLEEPNRYPTVYDLPSCGGYPAVIGTCQEAPDAHVVVKGKDLTGREIYSVHKGEKVVGVYLTIEKGKLHKSEIKFGQISEVSKTKTNGYTTLISLDDSCLVRKFLSDYEPYETAPSYRRAKLILTPCPEICFVSILGRIKLKDHYADDDLIPFDNILLLNVAGQTVNSMFNSDVQVAIAKDNYVEKLIEKEGNYKKVNNGQPIEVYRPLSGGMVKNARSAGRLFRRRAFWR